MIVGSGVAGTLVARELAAKGLECVIVERGGLVPWEEQRRTERWEAQISTAEHDHEVDPSGIDWPWSYVYGVGGGCNRWAGTSPRFLPEDFEMRSRYGVMSDWPISYADLLPYYVQAEKALSVSGERNDLMPGAGFPLPPHPLSPQDTVVADALSPFIALPQARPSRSVGGRAACCGSGRCQLCPVDARFSVLNGLGEVFERPEIQLMAQTRAARLVSDPSGRRIQAVECVTSDGEWVRVSGERFVIAANGIESPALMMRSGIATPETGRYLFDHRNTKLLVPTRAPVGAGRGASLVTGASYAYYRGDFRRKRAAALVLPFNPGAPTMPTSVVEGIVAGRSGRSIRRAAVAEFERTLALDLYLDDEPNRRAGVQLSSRRDSFGIPLNAVRWEPPTAYFNRALTHIARDLPRRLGAVVGGRARPFTAPQGAHQLGTLRMGSGSEGVVDPDLRHVLRENLFVSGGAVFPTYSPSHPTLTIAALAVRLGRLLATER